MFKKDFEMYWDRVLDACEDTGVGEPTSGSHPKYKDYFKTIVAPNNYKYFAKWLYDRGFNVDLEINFFNKKYLSGRNSREASYQVLEFEYEKWIYEIWDTVINV